MTIITRFPPSPTGFMHIGNARTALYNWLYARRHGGKMLFRIEDTDRARHSDAAVDAIVNGLKWLELDWDGEIVSQFARMPRHTEVANELLTQGKAYKCYCSPAELDEMRARAKAEGKATFYDRRWRDSDATPPPGVNPVIRIKAPLTGSSTVHDHVQGDVTVANEQLDDFIILRSDGVPTYLLAVVVDDHDMGVNWVVRGDDHLNNTFRQNVIYDAMNWAKPEYAHLPLILGPDGAKMSKRHGAATVEEYRDMGYLPEAMRNYLLRLGWSHGDDEIISTEQAVQWFGLDHVGKSAARFDFVKLENLNAHYIQNAGNERLLDLVTPFLLSRHKLDISKDTLAQSRLLKGMDELKKRAKTLIQIADEGAFFAKKIPFSMDEKAQTTLTPDAKKVLAALMDRLNSPLYPPASGGEETAQADSGGENNFTAAHIEQIVKQIAEEMTGGKLGLVAMPLRAALTGTTVSPSIFHAAEILGREETLARIKSAIE
jgi:glutamyl-tRNA synthetase